MEATTAHAHEEGGSRLYIWIWFWLLALTALEVVLAYIQLFSLHVMLTILMALSIAKAALIVAYFMHLKFERASLIATLIPSLVVTISLLAIFFPDSVRLLHMRSFR